MPLFTKIDIPAIKSRVRVIIDDIRYNRCKFEDLSDLLTHGEWCKIQTYAVTQKYRFCVEFEPLPPELHPLIEIAKLILLKARYMLANQITCNFGHETIDSFCYNDLKNYIIH